MALFLDRFFFPKKAKNYDYAELLNLALTISVEMRSIREQLFFAIVSESKKYFDDFIKLEPLLVPGSTLESVLIGYQLCCVMGFTMIEGYISQTQFTEFNRLCEKEISKNNPKQWSFFRERYLDYQGDIEKIEALVFQDIVKAFMTDFQIDIQTKSTGIRNNIRPLGILSQPRIADIFGDSRTAKDLRGQIKLI